jgi:NADPH-dependent ferric siderophore reductase
MPNITVTHAESGLIHAEVVRRERVTPNMVRVTLGGDDLRRFEYRGFDQWFRLALPVSDDADLARMPQKFGVGGYLSYLRIPKGRRPVVRNYTVRDFRGDELDIDFVAHGTEGVAGPWAAGATAGDRVAFIDQGCGSARPPTRTSSWPTRAPFPPRSASCATCPATPSAMRSSSSSTSATGRMSTRPPAWRSTG